MIIKWQSQDAVWHTTDGVSNVINHGYVTHEELHKLAHDYDGEPGPDGYGGAIVHVIDGAHVREIDETVPDHLPFYLVVTVRGHREHWAIQNIRQGFLLSDEGKTVDRLLH